MVKRVTDIIFSLILLIIFAPVMLLVALVIAFNLGKPVIFRQYRPGLHGEIFVLYKFRTMKDEIGPNGEIINDVYRVTPVSEFIRKASLDELPELFNVLKGNMSLVGPRPLMPQYLSRYTPEQARRHDVKPGITGLAQISGRRNIPFSKRLELDVYYVDHQSLWFDLKILLLTIPSVLFTHGAEGPCSAAIDDLGMLSSLEATGNENAEKR